MKSIIFTIIFIVLVILSGDANATYNNFTLDPINIPINNNFTLDPINIPINNNFTLGIVNTNFTLDLTPTVTISCPAAGWCYVASNYTSKTLLELDNMFSTDTIQGRYNRTSKKYENHRTGYAFNQYVSVEQKKGYYYYFTSAQDVTMTPGSTPSITLKTGWSLTSNYGATARTLAELKSSIGVAATQTQYYDRSSKSWVITDSQSVPAMEAFFVYVTSETPWSG